MQTQELAPPAYLEDYLASAILDHTHSENLPKLMMAIANASVQLARLLASSYLCNNAQIISNFNVQGEQQTSVDVLSNQLYLDALKGTNLVAGAVSEEIPEPVMFDHTALKKPFLVNFDPLDGSSNLAVNGVVGSIFSVLETPNGALDANAFLQKGEMQLAALYVIYGPATMLVLTVGCGTQIFTLNETTGRFQLTHPNVKIAQHTSEYAINSSNARFWEKPVQRYVAECVEGCLGDRKRDFNMRWAGSMVADVHRIIIRGGVFLYPKDNKQPNKKGRLRLLYEANPMSLLVEHASGKSSTGRARILALQPTDIHERVPVVLGAQEEVTLLDLYYLCDEQNIAEQIPVDALT